MGLGIIANDSIARAFALGTGVAGGPLTLVARDNPLPTSGVGSRPIAEISGVLPNGTNSYATKRCVGGKLVIPTGLTAGTPLSGTVALRALFDTLTTAGQLSYVIFNADPGTSTFNDNADISLAAADLAKARNQGSLGAWSGTAGSLSRVSFTFTRVPVGPDGSLWVVFYATSTFQCNAANGIAYDCIGVY